MFNPFPYQSQGINDIRQSLSNKFTAPLYVLPTGGGKTVVFSLITKSALEKGKRITILVHRIELIRQTSDKLTEMGVPHGIINSNYTPNYSLNVQVASVQTLINRIHLTKTPDLLIIDEAHHAVAGSWNKIINAYNCLILGVTATPIRTDGKGLGKDFGGVFDTIVFGPTVNELISLNRLVRPRLFRKGSGIDISNVHIVRGDFDKGELQKAVDKPHITGNAIAEYTKYCKNDPAIVFCVSVEHAGHVAAEFQAAGYNFIALDGQTDDETRKSTLIGLANGTVHGICSCDLISEGVDVPAVRCIISLRPSASVSLVIQQWGRGLRVHQDKTDCIILDHAGNSLRHDMLPTTPIEWTLAGMTKRKKKSDAEKTIRTRQCEKCYGVHEAAPVCPYCGNVYKIEPKQKLKYVEGSLKEVTEIESKQKRIEVGRAADLDALIKIGQERGYKKGWAENVYKAKLAKKLKI
jgi:DNA repair protein RadD